MSYGEFLGAIMFCRGANIRMLSKLCRRDCICRRASTGAFVQGEYDGNKQNHADMG